MKKLTVSILIIFFQILQHSSLAQLPPVSLTTNSTPSNGYTFLASYGTPASGTWFLLIMDKNGNEIYGKSFPTSMNGNLADFKPQPNNKYSFFNEKQSCHYIMDKYFNIIDTVTAQNGFSTDIHEFLITQDNHYFLIADEYRTIDMSLLVFGGNTSAKVMGTVIQELDSNKKVVFQWKSLDHIPITDCLGQDLTAANIDYIHTNSLWLDSDTTLIMSNRHLNELTKISLNTGNIIWRMGLNASENQFKFINDSLGYTYQHHARRMPNGNITLFDNGDLRTSGTMYSRACEYKIDEKNKTATLVWQYRNSPDVYGNAMGSVQRLSNGNTAISWGYAHPNITEVDTYGNKVFELAYQYIYTYRAQKYNISNPTLAVITGSSLVSIGETAIYTAIPDPKSTFVWSVSNATILSGQGTNVLKLKWPTVGKGSVTLTKTNSINYKDYYIINVTISENPIANISVTSVCNGARFIDSTYNSVKRIWYFGDGDTSSLVEVTHYYTVADTYSIKLKVFNSLGYTDSIIQKVIISKAPKADFSIDSLSCVSETINIINNSTNASSYYWDLGLSKTSKLITPLAFSYNVAGTYYVKLVASITGCQDSMTKAVLVNPNPKAYMSFTPICNGERFIDSTTNSVKCIWDFGDGDTSTLVDISHTYTAPGTYNVKLEVFSSQGCIDSSKQSVTIYKAPKADFSIDSLSCVSETITIINNSTNTTSYSWNLGNSQTSNMYTPSAFSYNSAGSYYVKLIVTGAVCKDSMTKAVLVNPNPKAYMSITQICNGARFIDSTSNSVKRIWDFGDGDTSTLVDISHTYTAPGTYHVKLEVYSSQRCIDSSKQSITIYKAPKADFIIDTLACVSETIDIINNSSNATSYSWDLGDSQTSNMITPSAFSYNAADTYYIKLKAFNSQGCTDSSIEKVIINKAPKADFSINTNTCVSETIDIINNSTNATSYFWDLGDYQTSTLTIPPAFSYNTAGSYLVKLVASGARCKDSVTKVVMVNPTPVAKFGSAQQTNNSIQFNDSSTIITGSITSWSWYFGDDDTSVLQNPIHIFAAPNTYSVKLCVTSDGGCENCVTKSINVSTNGINQIVLDNTINIYPNPSNGIFTVKSSKLLDLIVVSNTFGKEIAVVKPHTDLEIIDMTNEPNGVYFVKLSSEKQNRVVRIVKE